MVGENKRIKASFRLGTLADRQEFKYSRCIVPISVGQRAHENEKFLATINLINRSFSSCVLLVDDTLQRYTLKMSNHFMNEAELYSQSLLDGDLWLKRNENIYNKLSIPYTVIRWDKWLKHPEYKNKYAQITEAYDCDNNYKKAFNESIEEYLSRNTNNINNYNHQDAYNLCLNYLKEECAAMCLWITEECHFELYPSGRSKAMAATYELFIKPYYPNLLRSVALRFKKFTLESLSI